MTCWTPRYFRHHVIFDVLFFVRVIFQVWSSAGFYFGIPLDDPTASDYLVFLIEDGGLAGGDGALGLVEEGVDGMVVDAAERGHGRGVAMADLRADADGFAFGEAGDGDPVESVGEEVAGEEICVGAYG